MARGPRLTRDRPSATASASSGDAERERARTARRINTNSYSLYIYRVLKQVHPSLGISKKAMAIFESMLADLFERIGSEAALVARRNRKSTITARDIKTAVTLVLPGDLAKHANGEAASAMGKFESIASQ